MILFENITTDSLANVTFSVDEGSVCKIIVNSDDEKDDLLQTLTGLKPPVSGRVSLFGKEIYSIPRSELYILFKRTGMVWRGSGLISNLKVWENITLPAWYHYGRKPAEQEEEIAGLFRELGRDVPYVEALMQKPSGPLPLHEKILVNLVRALMMAPELMIYDSLFEGFTSETAKMLGTMVSRYHAEKEGRIALHVSSDEQSLAHVKATNVLRQTGDTIQHDSN
jgi:phospholipid/cholesterol/gamma-HCH transport system ATP-binding protein